VTSLDDLITSKEFAGRRKDAEALPSYAARHGRPDSKTPRPRSLRAP
jgi:hypothetical protein